MKRTRARMLAAMAAGCAVFAMNGAALRAQAATGSEPVGSRTFEVATVKPSDPNKQGGTLMMDGEKFWTEGQTLQSILKFAYGLSWSSDQQIVGGPKWLGELKWDVDAKEDADSIAVIAKMTPEQRQAQLKLMVQALLADRFHVKVHRETRELPVYALVVGKGGAKLNPGKPPATGPDGKQTGWSGAMNHGKGDVEFRNAPLSMLANGLGAQPEIGGKTVMDKTGLTGKYDFELKWTPDLTAANDESNGASLFTALQDELGLKVESTKAPVEVVVIDAVEMPTEN